MAVVASQCSKALAALFVDMNPDETADNADNSADDESSDAFDDDPVDGPDNDTSEDTTDAPEDNSNSDQEDGYHPSPAKPIVSGGEDPQFADCQADRGNASLVGARVCGNVAVEV